MTVENTNKLIGISGTNGSGKDTIGNILANNYGFWFCSLSDILREELKNMGLSSSRENMRELSTNWRREFGVSILVDKAQAEFTQQEANYIGLAMASIRNPGEADAIHQAGGLMLWVDADPKIRYQRVKNRSEKGGLNSRVDDLLTFDQFINEEAAEMNHPKITDGMTLSMSKVKSKCDIFIQNNGQDLTELTKLIGQRLNLEH